MEDVLRLDIRALEERFRARESRDSAEPPFIIRMDGVGFSKLRRMGFRAPRDPRVHDALTHAAQGLLRRYGFYAAHIVSDEINIYVFNPRPPYSGRIEKLVSITASMASAAASVELGVPIFFDSRIVPLLDQCEASKYLAYRARIGLGNYAGSLAKNLGVDRKPRMKLNTLLKLLEEKGVRIAPGWESLGTLVLWEPYFKEAKTPGGERAKVVRRRLSSYSGLQALRILEDRLSSDYGCLARAPH